MTARINSSLSDQTVCLAFFRNATTTQPRNPARTSLTKQRNWERTALVPDLCQCLSGQLSSLDEAQRRSCIDLTGKHIGR